MNNDNTRITFEILPSDKENIEDTAKQFGLSLSAFCRFALIEKIRAVKNGN